MKPRKFRENGYKVGKYVKLYKRIQGFLDSRAELGHSIRVRTGSKIVELSPTWDNPNFDDGTIAGALVAGVAAVIDEYVPIASDTEITDVEPTEDGAIYTINVDAPFPQQAKFQGMIESGAGYSSFVTDRFDVGEPMSLRERPARDTWQVEVEVKEHEPNADADVVLDKLGILD